MSDGKLIEWNSMSAIDWKSMTVAPRTEDPTVVRFSLVIHCHTATEREQIAAELTKHGIKCEAVS